MPIDLQNFDIRTGVRLYAPKEMGVTLVPLQDVEGAEFSLFWSAVFLGFASAGLGASLSMIASEYENTEVVVLLGLFTLVFTLLTIGFCVYGFRKRQEARSMAQTPTGDALDPETLRKQQKKMTDDAVAIYELMKSSVFDESDSLTLDEFKRKTGLALQLQLGVDSNDKANMLVNLLRYLNIIRFENEDTDHETAHFDKTWCEDKLRQTFMKLTGIARASSEHS